MINLRLSIIGGNHFLTDNDIMIKMCSKGSIRAVCVGFILNVYFTSQFTSRSSSVFDIF